MIKQMGCRGAASILAFLACNATAADFDGSKPMTCAVTEVLECVEVEDCSRRTTEETAAPEFLKINVKKKKMIAITDTAPRESEIGGNSSDGGTLVLQGIENGAGWSVSINEERGEMSAAVVRGQQAFLLFGNCILP